MKKIDYFEFINALAENMTQTVSLACRQGNDARKNEREESQRLCKLKALRDEMISEVEKSLFSDFITPIQRDRLGALAHSLWRVSERAVLYKTFVSRSNIRTGESYTLLAKMIAEGAGQLKSIRATDDIPDVISFRRELRELYEKNEKDILNRSGAYAQFFVSELLRFEMSRCFDTLVEIMLSSI